MRVAPESAAESNRLDGAPAAHLELGVISEGVSAWPLYVAQATGLFERAGLHVETTVVGSSVKQQADLIAGRYDIGFQQADHIVRAVERGADLVAFAAQSHAPEVTLVAVPGIGAIEDLRGRAIGVDGARTGYALLLMRLLQRHGLTADDVELVEIGGSKERYDAIRRGTAAACMLNAPFDESLVETGCTRLARLSDAFPDYPGSVMGARRRWADAHRRELAAFVGALNEAYGWLQQPANRERALALLPERLALAPHAARAALEHYTARERPRLTAEGMRRVIDVVWDAEGYAAPRGDPARYMDVSYAGPQ